jgi:hypothetical protein
MIGAELGRGGPEFDPPQLRSGGRWNHLMPELTLEPDKTGGERQKKKNCGFWECHALVSFWINLKSLHFLTSLLYTP